MAEVINLEKFIDGINVKEIKEKQKIIDENYQLDNDINTKKYAA